MSILVGCMASKIQRLMLDYLNIKSNAIFKIYIKRSSKYRFFGFYIFGNIGVSSLHTFRVLLHCQKSSMWSIILPWMVLGTNNTFKSWKCIIKMRAVLRKVIPRFFYLVTKLILTQWVRKYAEFSMLDWRSARSIAKATNTSSTVSHVFKNAANRIITVSCPRYREIISNSF